MPFAIGIDIGTANTRVAVFRRGKVEIIPDQDGNELMPSYVAFSERGRLFGGAAKAQAESNSKNTIYGIKPLLGRSCAGTSRESFENFYHGSLPYLIERSDDREFIVTAQYKGRSQRFTLVELFAMLLVKAKRNAEVYLAEPVSEAVISVPVDFDLEQRDYVQGAAIIAGIKLLRICTAIESIALHVYAADKRYDSRPHWEPQEDRIVVILDQGANSIDFGLAIINHGTITILAQQNNRWHGGDEFVRCVARCIDKQISAKGIVKPKDRERLSQLARAASEAAMKDLTLNSWIPVRINTLGGRYDCTVNLAREDFETEVERKFVHWNDYDLMDMFLKESKSYVSDISELIMVGGCSKIPVVQRHWTNYFGDTPFSLSSKADVSEVSGSAIYAAILNRSANSKKLKHLQIFGSLPSAIGIGPIRIKTVTSKVLGSLRPFVNDRTISAWERRTAEAVAKRHATLPGKWSCTFPIRELFISLSKPAIYIYQNQCGSKLLIGELDVRSLLSPPPGSRD